MFKKKKKKKSGCGHPWHKESTIKAWEEASLSSARARWTLRGFLQSQARLAALPLTDMWHSCLPGQRSQALMVIDIRKCHVWICFSWTFLPHFISCLLPSVYFNYTVKTLKYGIAACCITPVPNCTPELDHGILSPCNGKRHICNRSRSWNIFCKCQWISRPLLFLY